MSSTSDSIEYHREQLKNRSSLKSPSLTLSTLPEELRQEIISYLNYYDAWSLKRVSRLFLQVVEIPTIASFLAWPSSGALDMLEEWAIIPIGYEACYYCHKLLSASHYSRFQRRLTSVRQRSPVYDYQSWKPQKHYCIACGIENHIYERGRPICIGFGDPGTKWETTVPCTHCGVANPTKEWFFFDCGYCFNRVRITQSAGQAQNFVKSSNKGVRETAAAHGMGEVHSNEVRPELEPSIWGYMYATPKRILALAGEELLCEEQDKENEYGHFNMFEGYLNALE